MQAASRVAHTTVLLTPRALRASNSCTLARPTRTSTQRGPFRSGTFGVTGPPCFSDSLRFPLHTTIRRWYANHTSTSDPLTNGFPGNVMKTTLEAYNAWRSKYGLPPYTASNITVTWIAPTPEQTPEQSMIVQDALRGMMQGVNHGTLDELVNAYDEMLWLFVHPSLADTKEWRLRAVFPHWADRITDITALPGVQSDTMGLTAWVARVDTDGNIDLDELEGPKLSTMRAGLGRGTQHESLRTLLQAAQILIENARHSHDLPSHEAAKIRYVTVKPNASALPVETVMGAAQISHTLRCIQEVDEQYGKEQVKDYNSIDYLCVAPSLARCGGDWAVIPLFPDRAEMLRQIEEIPGVDVLYVIFDDDGNLNVQLAEMPPFARP